MSSFQAEENFALTFGQTQAALLLSRIADLSREDKHKRCGCSGRFCPHRNVLAYACVGPDRVCAQADWIAGPLRRPSVQWLLQTYYEAQTGRKLCFSAKNKKQKKKSELCTSEQLWVLMSYCRSLDAFKCPTNLGTNEWRKTVISLWMVWLSVAVPTSEPTLVIASDISLPIPSQLRSCVPPAEAVALKMDEH